jgi:hypothetical protein
MLVPETITVWQHRIQLFWSTLEFVAMNSDLHHTVIVYGTKTNIHPRSLSPSESAGGNNGKDWNLTTPPIQCITFDTSLQLIKCFKIVQVFKTKAQNKWCRIAICYPNFRNCYTNLTPDLQFASQNYTQTNKICEEMQYKIIFLDCIVWKISKIATHQKSYFEPWRTVGILGNIRKHILVFASKIFKS